MIRAFSVGCGSMMPPFKRLEEKQTKTKKNTSKHHIIVYEIHHRIFIMIITLEKTAVDILFIEISTYFLIYFASSDCIATERVDFFTQFSRCLSVAMQSPRFDD